MEKFLTAFLASCSKFIYFFTNFGNFCLVSKFIISSNTKTCPSQKLDDPIPIVGIDIEEVIFLAVSSIIHSNNIAFAPAFSAFIARYNKFSISFCVFPTTLILLKLMKLCGVTPICAIIFNFLSERYLTIDKLLLFISNFKILALVNFNKSLRRK